MINGTLRIATRKSPMALWQANFIKAQILAQFPQFNIELVELVTRGDKDTSRSLIDIGGKSLFVKELQQALLNNEADIAVHCIKDMSVHAHSQLELAAVCERDTPSDALISRDGLTLRELADNAVIGTASPRRTSLLKSLRPDLEIKVLRGNVNTRLKKLEDGLYDAIICATSGLERLQFDSKITEVFDTDYFTPAIGQGALGIECRSDDTHAKNSIKHLHHEPTARCITAERAINRKLGGDCHTPIGAYAVIEQDHLKLHGVVASLDGTTVLRAKISGKATQAEQLGYQLAEDLLAQGAAQFVSQDH